VGVGVEGPCEPPLGSSHNLLDERLLRDQVRERKRKREGRDKSRRLSLSREPSSSLPLSCPMRWWAGEEEREGVPSCWVAGTASLSPAADLAVLVLTVPGANW
jgi:hypothetical protein